MEPVLASNGRRLGSSEDLNKTVPAESNAISEVVGARQVSVQACRVELSQNVYFADSTVDAVAHGDVNKTVSALKEKKTQKLV